MPLIFILFFLLCIGTNGAGSGLLPDGIGPRPSLLDEKDTIETEYRIKAAFIYNFMKFTEWPPEKIPAAKPVSGEDSRTPMIIGIVGENRFGKSFVPIQEKTIRDHPIRILEFPSLAADRTRFPSPEAAVESYSRNHLEQMRTCHVLFFCESEADVLSRFMDLLGESGILTISDIPRFIDQGGIIGFKKKDNKVRFEINLTRARRQTLRISSQLLKLAVRVKKEE